MKKTVVLLFALALLLAGCINPFTNNADNPQTDTENAMENDSMPNEPLQNETDAMNNENAMQASSYSPFSQAAFETAQMEGKPIFLNFYANWCPTCRAAEPGVVTAFEELSSDVSTVGFRVNYNDSETDADETALAERFGITYQHSYVLLNPDGSVSEKIIAAPWDQETLQQKLTALGN